MHVYIWNFLPSNPIELHTRLMSSDAMLLSSSQSGNNCPLIQMTALPDTSCCPLDTVVTLLYRLTPGAEQLNEPKDKQIKDKNVIAFDNQLYKQSNAHPTHLLMLSVIVE